MNILITLVGLICIIFAGDWVWHGTGQGINSHLIILLYKFIASSIIIGLFLISTEKDYWLTLILSGMVNFILFHFIEAFITQKLLVYKRGTNV